MKGFHEQKGEIHVILYPVVSLKNPSSDQDHVCFKLDLRDLKSRDLCVLLIFIPLNWLPEIGIYSIYSQRIEMNSNGS